MTVVLRRFLASILLLTLCAGVRAQWDYRIPLPRGFRQEPDTVTVTFIGDVMMHSRQLEYDCRDFLSELGEITLDADVSVANMEFTLAGPPYSGYPAFSAPDDYAKYVADRGVDVFLTANNHILDKGRGGLRRTLGVYEAMRDSCGVQYTGTAPDEASDTILNPLVVVGRGIRIALVNFTYGTNSGTPEGWPRISYMQEERVHEMFARAKERDADFIIALPHWGVEYNLRHSETQRKWAQRLVDLGADLIVGAHPHVVQDTTHIEGVPVIYSMGNAVSNMSAENTRLELAVRARFVRLPDGGARMLEPELIFLWCTLPGKLKNTYTTIPVADYVGRRDEWLDPSDYDNMMATYRRVLKQTGINEEDD